ncbi:MAG: hypothetical protein OSJ73_13420 [Lachnospiraceae bacterium]|nr:hypothetical protein [Lachnospiraceae bacterium]MCX4298014.1 hypothetical protein [Lachnospiraceae bacterium]
MENKADMPNWNRFVNEVLSSKFREQKKEAKQYTKDSKEKAIGKR